VNNSAPFEGKPLGDLLANPEPLERFTSLLGEAFAGQG
jgi:hypothetical protein